MTNIINPLQIYLLNLSASLLKKGEVVPHLKNGDHKSTK